MAIKHSIIIINSVREVIRTDGCLSKISVQENFENEILRIDSKSYRDTAGI